MFYIPFWIFIAIVVILAGAAISVRKPRFIDIQIMIMVIAVAMSCDMLLCKQFKLYNYVSTEYRGWYSFWANFVACPAIGLIFIKFIPTLKIRVALYIVTWSIVLTLFELYILKPSGILYTHGWHTIPWSPIGYCLALILEYTYFKILLFLNSKIWKIKL